MTPIVTLLTGMGIGAVGTWLYNRGITLPKSKRAATTDATVATETVTGEAPVMAEATTTAAAEPAKRRWQMPTFRRTKATGAESAPAEVVTDAPVVQEAAATA